MLYPVLSTCCLLLLLLLLLVVITLVVVVGINQSINMSICIAPNKQKSSEVLAAKQRDLSVFANVSMESEEVRSSTGSLFHVIPFQIVVLS